jgi:hypothetical protein
MPKTAKASRPSSSQQSPKGFAALRHWYGKRSTTQLAIVALALLAAGFFGFKQAQIYQERNVYRSAEKQITAFVDEAAKLAPSTKEVRKYCSYSSAKFSKGYLGCSIDGQVSYNTASDDEKNELMKRIDTMQDKIGWKFIEDNTWNTVSEPTKEIKNNVYKLDTLTCGIAYRNMAKDRAQIVNQSDAGVLILDIHCSGTAQSEYYPV